jgi:hypothetical protein
MVATSAGALQSTADTAIQQRYAAKQIAELPCGAVIMLYLN